jgi:glucosamine 6-phosphate synthetase-like amidotransferase/phosphosugar isomerase protein
MYLEWIFKFLLWQRGGWKAYVGGPKSTEDYIRECYSPGDVREFDIFLAARGTSDNAGLYAKYLWGAFNRLPIALAAPSLFSIYSRSPTPRKALMVGISQSGQSPDTVSVVAEGGRQGAPTLVIANDPSSPLAQTAEFVIDIGAGPEEAVAATKTYTAQLLAIAMLSVMLSRYNYSGDLESLELSATAHFRARLSPVQGIRGSHLRLNEF